MFGSWLIIISALKILCSSWKVKLACLFLSTYLLHPKEFMKMNITFSLIHWSWQVKIEILILDVKGVFQIKCLKFVKYFSAFLDFLCSIILLLDFMVFGLIFRNDCIYLLWKYALHSLKLNNWSKIEMKLTSLFAN